MTELTQSNAETSVCGPRVVTPLFVAAKGWRPPVMCLLALCAGFVSVGAAASVAYNQAAPGVEYFLGAAISVHPGGAGKTVCGGEPDSNYAYTVQYAPPSGADLEERHVPFNIDGTPSTADVVSGTFTTGLISNTSYEPLKGWLVSMRVEAPDALTSGGRDGSAYVTVLKKGVPIPAGQSVQPNTRALLNSYQRGGGGLQHGTCYLDVFKGLWDINPDSAQPSSPLISVTSFTGYTVSASDIVEGTPLGALTALIPAEAESSATASVRWDPNTWVDIGAGGTVNRVTEVSGATLDLSLDCADTTMSDDDGDPPAYLDAASGGISCTIKKYGSTPAATGVYTILLQASMRVP